MARIRQSSIILDALLAPVLALERSQLTQGQFDALLREFLASQRPINSPLFGWYYGNREMLKQALRDKGLVVAPDGCPPLHQYRLSGQGFSRLGEIEAVINAAANHSEAGKEITG